MRNSTVCLEMSACQFSAPLKSWFSASFHVLYVLYDSIWLDTGACTMHIAHQIISYRFYFPLKFRIFLILKKLGCDIFYFASIIQWTMNRADFWTWIILSGKQIKTHTDVFKDICCFQRKFNLFAMVSSAINTLTKVTFWEDCCRFAEFVWMDLLLD